MFKKSLKKDLILCLVVLAAIPIANMLWSFDNHRFHVHSMEIELIVAIAFFAILIIKRLVTGAYRNEPKNKDE